MNATEIPVAQQLQCIQGSRHLIGVLDSELERGSGIVSNCLLNPPRTPSHNDKLFFIKTPDG